MTRTFYFLRDSLTGKFYTGQNNSLSDLANAAVYYRKINAQRHMKGIEESWEHDQKYADYWIEKKSRRTTQHSEEQWQNELTWAKDIKAQVQLRENLPQWGIVVVEGTVKITD